MRTTTVLCQIELRSQRVSDRIRVKGKMLGKVDMLWWRWWLEFTTALIFFFVLLQISLFLSFPSFFFFPVRSGYFPISVTSVFIRPDPGSIPTVRKSTLRFFVFIFSLCFNGASVEFHKSIYLYRSFMFYLTLQKQWCCWKKDTILLKRKHQTSLA